MLTFYACPKPLIMLFSFSIPIVLPGHLVNFLLCVISFIFYLLLKHFGTVRIKLGEENKLAQRQVSHGLCAPVCSRLCHWPKTISHSNRQAQVVRSDAVSSAFSVFLGRPVSVLLWRTDTVYQAETTSAGSSLFTQNVKFILLNPQHRISTFRGVCRCHYCGF